MLIEVKALENPEVRNPSVSGEAVSRARAGDPEAFHEIFQRYSRPVLAFIYNLLGDDVHAEELMQETFVRAYRGLGKMRQETQLSTWIFGIARNVVREAIRQKYGERRKVALDEAATRRLRAGDAGPDERVIAGELQQKIRAALGALPEDHRVVFVLKILHRMRYEEISRITGSSVGKLKTDLHRARMAMREELQPYLGGRITEMRGGL